MELSPTLLAGIASLASLAALGSYYIYQWLASHAGGSALPWFVSGLALAVILLGLALVIFQSLPNLRIANSAVELSIGSWGVDSSTRNHASLRGADVLNQNTHRTNAAGRQRDFRPRVRDATRPIDAQQEFLERDASSAQRTEQRTGEPSALADASRLTTEGHEPWLEDLSFWGATRCVLALRLDPEDPETWMLINECAVDVQILVATCASSTEACRQPRGASWSYVRNGMFLPAKATRSVAFDEQTVHGLHLRYAACRPSGVADSVRTNDSPAALRHVGVQSCDDEVRSLSLIGSRSGAQLDELVNEPVPANPCCSRPE